jgi:DNA primase large subunit
LRPNLYPVGDPPPERAEGTGPCPDLGAAKVQGAGHGDGEAQRFADAFGGEEMMDEETLEAYVRALRRSAEYLDKDINPIELKALIKRFMKLNPGADPKAVDWVGVWDPTLTYSELVESFQRNYPMYKWREDEEISEEAFKAMRRKKVEEVFEAVKELDEEALRELFELLKKELEPEAEIKPEPIPEKPEKTVVQEVKAPTLVQEAPTITLKVLARYPILPETKQFFEAFAVEELEGYAEATKLRIMEALQRGEKGVLPREDPIEDLLTFALARVLCIAIGEPWLLKRWALAEAARMERYLHVEVEELKKTVLKTGLNIEEVDEFTARKVGEEYSYRMHFAEYLRINRELTGPEWRLVNRTLTGGFVYLTEAETIRLFRQKAYKMLSSTENVPKVKIKSLPPKLAEAAEDIVKELVKLRSSYEPVTAPAPGDWPPCMEAIRARVAEASHKELFSLTAFMINRGYSKEEILALLAERPDFNEKIARYQIEHIAGERGSRTKYRPPSCQTMRSLGLCVEGGRLCPKWIRNPLEYRKEPKESQKPEKPKQTTQTPA